MSESNWRSSGLEPVAHVHTHEESEEFENDPEVQAYVTTLTVTVAHGSDQGPYEVVASLAKVIEETGLQGVVVGVSTVELRGAGGLIGL